MFTPLHGGLGQVRRCVPVNSFASYIANYRPPGLGQMTLEEQIRALPTRLPAAATSLQFQPGFRPTGQPGVYQIAAPPASGALAWLDRNRMVVYVGAGGLLLLAMSRGRRR